MISIPMQGWKPWWQVLVVCLLISPDFWKGFKIMIGFHRVMKNNFWICHLNFLLTIHQLMETFVVSAFAMHAVFNLLCSDLEASKGPHIPSNPPRMYMQPPYMTARWNLRDVCESDSGVSKYSDLCIFGCRSSESCTLGGWYNTRFWASDGAPTFQGRPLPPDHLLVKELSDWVFGESELLGYH